MRPAKEAQLFQQHAANRPAMPTTLVTPVGVQQQTTNGLEQMDSTIMTLHILITVDLTVQHDAIKLL
jgi:hypothetical protein